MTRRKRRCDRRGRAWLASFAFALLLVLPSLGSIARLAWAQAGAFSGGMTGLYVTRQEDDQRQPSEGQPHAGGAGRMPQTGVGVERLGLLGGGALLAAGSYLLLRRKGC